MLRQNAMKNKEVDMKKKGRLSSLNTSSNTSLHVNVQCQSQCAGSPASSTKTFVTLMDKNNFHNYGK